MIAMLLAIVPMVAAAQNYAGLPCVSEKATMGDRLSVTNPTLLERTYTYAPPRQNADGFNQELFLVTVTDPDPVRKAANDKEATWVLLHGGGYRGGSVYGQDWAHVAMNVLVPLGYDVALVEYRTGWVVCDLDTPTIADFCASDSNKFRLAVEMATRDGRDAIRYLKRNAADLGIADSFYVAGSSAGGSMATYMSLLNAPFADSMGIHGGYLGYGGYGFDRIEHLDARYLLSHNPNDPIAPWKDGRLYRCSTMTRNIGYRSLYDSLVALGQQTALVSACKGGHGLSLGQNFGELTMWDTLFVGQTGILTDFLPKAWAGTYGQQRLVYPNVAATEPTIGGTCPCEPTCP